MEVKIVSFTYLCIYYNIEFTTDTDWLDWMIGEQKNSALPLGLINLENLIYWIIPAYKLFRLHMNLMHAGKPNHQTERG